MLEQENRKASLAGDPAGDPADPAARERRWAEHWRSAKFMSAHYHELFRQYPGQWVGVYLEEVAAVAPTARELLAKAAAQGIPCGNMYLSFMGNMGTPRRTPFRLVRRS